MLQLKLLDYENMDGISSVNLPGAVTKFKVSLTFSAPFEQHRIRVVLNAPWTFKKDALMVIVYDDPRTIMLIVQASPPTSAIPCMSSSSHDPPWPRPAS
jgi:hypothetical protein